MPGMNTAIIKLLPVDQAVTTTSLQLMKPYSVTLENVVSVIAGDRWVQFELDDGVHRGHVCYNRNHVVEYSFRSKIKH